MVNFRIEVLNDISRSGHSENDVISVSMEIHGKIYCVNLGEFLCYCDFNYDNGYGFAEINESLKILFEDGSWLERKEYDGREWFSYVKRPEIGTKININTFMKNIKNKY